MKPRRPRRPPLTSYSEALWEERQGPAAAVRDMDVHAFNAARRSRLKCDNLRAVAAQLRLGMPLTIDNLGTRRDTEPVVKGIERFLKSGTAARRG